MNYLRLILIAAAAGLGLRCSGQNGPVGCDTMVALSGTTVHGQTLFAKNSDRPPEECQPLVLRPREKHPAGSAARMQFVELPQAATTYRHVGSRPYWCQGYEHGFNEFQVVIGNEGLSSKWSEAQEPKLIGMELLRLGLERGRTAAEAVEVMTALITRHGQGKFKNAEGVRTYDNGYIVADPREAYIVETAGHEWAVKKIDGALGISNVHSVGTDWLRLSPEAQRTAVAQGWWRSTPDPFNFARAYGDPEQAANGSGVHRRIRSCGVLGKHQGSIDLETMFALVRDHADGSDPGAPFQRSLPLGVSICMHSRNARGSNTAASLVADLCADGSRLPVYWCSMYSPCLGVFQPIFVEGELPARLALGGKEPDSASPWWRFRNLGRLVTADASGKAADQVRAAWQKLESEFIGSAYRIAVEARMLIDTNRQAQASRMLSDYMENNLQKVLLSLENLLAGLQK
jgi:secernin